MSETPRASSGAFAQIEPLLEAEDIRVWFPIKRGVLRRRVGWVCAVDGVDLSVRPRETLGLVGEPGSGKSTLARAIVRIEPLTTGRVGLAGEDLTDLEGPSFAPGGGDSRWCSRTRIRVSTHARPSPTSLDEPLRVHELAGGRRRERAAQLMELVGLNPAFAGRYPHQFSGGQRQRIGIARAHAVEPDLIVCDEPLSALDVSIQAQIINLLEDLQAELGLTYLFISHDLAVVHHIANRVGVMYLGRVV